MNQALLPGTQVMARGLQWEVVHVEPAGEQQRYRLRCAEGDLRGLEFDFLHPLEVIEPVASELSRRDSPRFSSAWILVSSADLSRSIFVADARESLSDARSSAIDSRM